MAMILACGAVLHYAGRRGHAGADRASRAIYESVLEATRRRRAHAGPRRPREHDGVHDEVVARVRTKIDVWSSLGTTV